MLAGILLIFWYIACVVFLNYLEKNGRKSERTRSAK